MDLAGELDFDEFKRAIRRTAKISVEKISDRELKKLFRIIDTDRGGSVRLKTVSLDVHALQLPVLMLVLVLVLVLVHVFVRVRFVFVFVPLSLPPMPSLSGC